jgi:hypothetical protein
MSSGETQYDEQVERYLTYIKEVTAVFTMRRAQETIYGES